MSDEAAATPAPPAPDQGANKKKKKKKRSPLARIIFIIALVIFLTAGGILGFLLYSYWSEQNNYDEIATDHFKGNASATLADLVVDWDGLRKINPDVVAWVYMPDTMINYPVAHKKGDSEYYLHHNFSNDEGKYGAEFGCIMLNGDNNPKFTDEVNILYGHHMRNGSMFALFAEFRESKVFNQHRNIYLLTPQGNYLLETFAVEHVPMTYAEIATPNYPTQEEFTDFKKWLKQKNIVKPDPNNAKIKNMKQVFGFSTCDGADNTWRYITFAEVKQFLPIEYVGTDHAAADVENGSAKDIKGEVKGREKN